MSNIIKIKRGNGAPPAGTLLDGELGFDKANDQLYIGNGTEQISLIPKSAADVGAVPTTRTVNNKALSSNITLSASDVGARASTWVPSASDITSGTLSSDCLPTVPVAHGGTGGATAAEAMQNLMERTTVTDANVCLESGNYYTTPDTTNIPVAGYGNLRVVKTTVNWIWQSWQSVYSSVVYTRNSRDNGVTFDNWDTGFVKNVATASGALYATAANGAPKFGVLPYAQGGTGRALGDVPNYAIMRNAGDGDYMWYLATGNGALFATAANGAPRFGTLPIAQGGTGATSAANARTNLGAKMKLLWINASPTSTFASFAPLTNAYLDESLANFTAIMIWFNITPESTQHAPFVIPIGIGSGTSTDDVKNATICFTTGDNKWVRRYCWATTSGITFGAGGYKTSLSANWTVNSKYMVPERIYGIR